jgi:hypothetical protein
MVTRYNPGLEVSAMGKLVRAGLLTGITDGLFSSVLSAFFYGSTVMRLWQGVAATLIPNAFEGGVHTAAIGVFMHFGVAFTWSAIFIFLLMRSTWVRGLIETWPGVARVAAVFGPSIWLIMSFVVIPLLTHRPPAITYRWWVQLVGHFPFVGLPIVAMSRDH